MTRLRIAVPSLAVLLVALACAEQAPPDEEAAVDDTQAAAAMDPTCDEPSDKEPTGRMVMFSVDDDDVTADPDPVVQRVTSGAIRWKMDPGSSDYGWKVVFENDDSPLDAAVYVDSSGGTQGGTVRTDAECKSYKYSVTVWPQGNPSDSTRVDPGADIIP